MLTGTFTPPGGPSKIPPPTPEDMAIDAAKSYQVLEPGWEKTQDIEAPWQEMMNVWIRRAVHAERFAKALEEELEKLRAEKRGEQ